MRFLGFRSKEDFWEAIMLILEPVWEPRKPRRDEN